MKRVLLLVVVALAVTAVVVVAGNLLPQAMNGLAVAPNKAPAPGLIAQNWACYQTCVLPSDIVLGDFGDADGWLDIAVSCSGTGQVQFLINDPLGRAPGVFGVPAPITAVGDLPAATSLVADESSVHVLVNPYSGGFTWGVYTTNLTLPEPPLRTVVPTPAALSKVVGGHIDHDGALDLITLEDGGAINAYMADASLSGPLGIGVLSSPVSAVVGDFNQDGWNDLAVLESGLVTVFFQAPFASLGAAVPTFLPIGTQVALPIEATAIDVGDFNADGLLDFVVVGQQESGTAYAVAYVNEPATPGAAFEMVGAQPMKTWGFEPRDVVVADFDGNGRDDFAVANYGSRTVTMFLSDATGLESDNRSTTERCLNSGQVEEDHLSIGFGLYKLELQCGYYPLALDAGDLDWNGKVDLVVALESSDEEICPQNRSCIEVIFDPACGFHSSGSGAVPNQLPHLRVPTVAGAGEATDCPDGCETGDCGENKAPNAEIETMEESGN